MTKQSQISRRRSFVASLLSVAAFCTAAIAAEPARRHPSLDDAAGNMQVTTTKTMETYVPTSRSRVSAIELRSEATITTADVTLKQVCRWPEADAESFAEVADLVVLRLADKPFATLTIDQVQATLRDAGINPALVNFAGAATCTVSRGDVKPDEGTALAAWVSSTETTKADAPSASDQMQAELIGAAAERQANKAGKGDSDPAVVAAEAKTGDLRAQLIRDVASRLNLPADVLQVDFKAEDRKILSLAAPFEFTFEPQRHGDLGETSWIVTVSTGNKSQRVRIAATSRAWMEQLVLARPLGLRQTISEADFETKRILADKLSRDPLATRDGTIGQQAARDLKAGTVLTTKMLAPVELVRAGQLVTVHMRRGSVEVKSVAVALQSGTDGQAIKVKNELTNQVYQVTLTGPQTAVLTSSDPVATIAE